MLIAGKLRCSHNGFPAMSRNGVGKPFRHIGRYYFSRANRNSVSLKTWKGSRLGFAKSVKVCYVHYIEGILWIYLLQTKGISIDIFVQ